MIVVAGSLWCMPAAGEPAPAPVDTQSSSLLQASASALSASPQTDQGNSGSPSLLLPLLTSLILLTLLFVFCLRQQRHLAALNARNTALEAESALLKLSLDRMPQAVFWYGPDLQITLTNKAARKIAGASMQAMLTGNIADFDPDLPPDREGRRRAWQELTAQTPVRRSGKLCTPTGICRPVEAEISHLPTKAGGYLLVIAEEISDRHSREQEREILATELRQAKDMAEKASRLKSEFLSNMSHEIRTPMNAIIGYSELLAQAPLSEQEKEYAQTIIRSGKALIMVINDILDLSKIEAGRLEIQPQAVDTCFFFQDIGNMFTERARSKDLDLRLEIPADLPSPINIDEKRLRQVLFNLLGNAVTFTDKGHVSLRIRHGVLSPSRIALTIIVEDSGIGISEADQQTLFEPFHKGSDARQARNSGKNGLGLALSRRLINLMGGSLTLNSTPGQGSTFEILLPTIELTAISPAAPTRSRGDRLVFQSGHVLVVDDMPLNCRLITDFFRKSAIKISTAANGKEALALLQGDELPDIILMDLKMPVMDGYQTTALIKKDPKLANIPIIAMSASVVSIKNDDSLFEGSLTKPFQIADLEKELARFLMHDTPELSPATADEIITPLADLDQTLLTKIQLILRQYDKKSGNLKEACQMGLEIEQLGDATNQPELARLGTTLRQSAERFDILQVEQIMTRLQKTQQGT